MEAIWHWGIDLIHRVQLIHGPALDTIFKAITFMGEEDFYMVLLPLILWCVDFPAGARLIVIFLFSAYANDCLKDLLTHPRPFDLDPTVKLHEAGGYGMPSGHSQSAVIIWGAIAAEFRRIRAWVTAILLMILIGFSRIYLGVHFPTDVLGGWAVGVALLATYLKVRPRLELWLKEAGMRVQLALALVVPAVMLLYPTGITTSVTGVLIGVGAGVALSRRLVPFNATGPILQRAERLLLGMVVLIAIRFGLKFVFPHEGESLYLAMRVLRYAVIGLWAGLGAPWLFVKLRLASSRG